MNLFIPKMKKLPRNGKDQGGWGGGGGGGGEGRRRGGRERKEQKVRLR